MKFERISNFQKYYKGGKLKKICGSFIWMIKFAKVHAIKCEQVEQERKQKCITRKMSKTKESLHGCAHTKIKTIMLHFGWILFHAAILCARFSIRVISLNCSVINFFYSVTSTLGWISSTAKQFSPFLYKIFETNCSLGYIQIMHRKNRSSNKES